MDIVIISYFLYNSVIVVLLLTSRMFKTAFNALPDIHQAFDSAESVVFLNSQHTPNFGRILVSVAP